MSSKTLVLCCSFLLGVSPLLAQQTAKPFNSTASRIVGQPSLLALDSSNGANIVEGREFWRPMSVAVDTTSSPSALYVSDTVNNRVLGWANVAGYVAGDPATIVIGQRDMQTTYAKGPGTTLTRGLSSPTGIAVDSQGNLYVVDSGNNRILRYPKPFVSEDNRLNPDLLIGQANFDSKSANRGVSLPAADSVYTPTTGGSHPTAQQLVFDPVGNLWFTDTGNNRVLRYPKSGDKVATSADVVLGQSGMTTAVSSSTITDKEKLRLPTGIAIDSGSRVYVSDHYSRVLVYLNPVASGTVATRLLGLYYGTPETTINAVQMGLALGLVVIDNRLGVVDWGLHRIAIFDPYDSWPADGTNVSSPPAKLVVGQASLTASKASATQAGLWAPAQATVANNELYVADMGNNRVLVYAPGLISSPFGTVAATRVFGQRDFGYNGANMVDGRGLYLTAGYTSTATGVTGSLADGGDVSVDTTSTPPRLYVTDTYNHRVLGFKDARNVRPNDAADLVIGQADFFSASPNGTLNDESQRNDTTLYRPTGLAVDANGDLWVADRGNGRVLRFPKPFERPAGAVQQANLVLGQRDYTDKNTDASASNMSEPYGVAFMPEGHLLVSDTGHHRVLLFRKPEGGDFSSGARADAVFGQPDFVTSTAVIGSPDRVAFPRGIAVDSSGRLYLADMGNNRVVVYTQVASGVQTVAMLITNTAASTALRNPIDVAINQAGEIWVAEFLGAGVGQVRRYAEFSVLQAMTQPLPDFTLTPGTSTVASPPVGITHDGADNLIVAEFWNRVSFYFPPVWTTSAANYLPSASAPATYSHPCCAPGSIASLWPFSPSGMFGKAGDVVDADFSWLPNPIPMQTTLGDVQLLLSSATYAETAAPLYHINPGQINFQIPKDAPTAGSLNLTLLKPSTGQVLAAGSLAVRATAPGLLTQPSFPIGTLVGAPSGVTAVQVAAQNYDVESGGSITCNGMQGNPLPPSCPGGVRPAKRGEYIVLYLTGQGFISGMPADGDIASGTISTPMLPRVVINGAYVPDDHIQFSGLTPGLIGVWQINVKVPASTPPGAVRIMVILNDAPSSALLNPYNVIHVQ